ncbi:adenosylcobinamide-GDP ribazoletransferase [Aliamphritea spongicola]|uniref:adenosylcobinamide-GDP ribazoletransferase n=1 Tax=Aliamphritea spongicola TaxID=707589 RepID=UPI00196A38CB|nr:adenosylcobinamide-GDP ribazoletransferase [Aliamphritea spongicola]MBN3560726.1 adenosylcobinamide-GDP ribazoletransferase [Aliamphritea spongicola]
MKTLQQHYHLFFNALVFFTRLPAPDGIEYSQKNSQLANRYLPVIGLLIGSACALSFAITGYLFGNTIGILFAIATGILLTGALHEDGLADCADGFGGGWEKSQVLAIMKDSQLGSYGCIALLLALGLKFLTLTTLTDIILVMILAHTLSRFSPLLLIYMDQYVRADNSSKARTMSRGISIGGLSFAALPVILILIISAIFSDAYSVSGIWLSLLPAVITALACRRYFLKRIGGYTGDCLGACQQLSELSIYLYFCWLLT